MKRLLFATFFILINIIGFAQSDTSYWSKGGILGFNGSQSSFSNWSQGGMNQISVAGSVSLFANYTKAKASWDNSLLMDLGFSKQGNQQYRKSNDRLEFNTKYGYKSSEKWYYSSLFNFKSQFLNGYDYPNDSVKTYVSSFLSPAYMKLGLGMDYMPNKNLSLFLSPVTTKITIVEDQALADAGKFGLEKQPQDSLGVYTSHSKNIKTEIGALLRFSYSKDILTNVNFKTILELYSNYLKNPQNVDVDWQTVLTFKVNNYLNAQLQTHLIYDDDVNIDVKNKNGVIIGNGPRLQFYENFSLGLVYKLK